MYLREREQHCSFFRYAPREYLDCPSAHIELFRHYTSYHASPTCDNHPFSNRCDCATIFLGLKGTFVLHDIKGS